MRIPEVLRVARRRTLRVARSATEQVVLRGVFPRLLSWPPPASGSERRTKPHLLVARYKYYSKNQSLGVSHEAQFLDDTLMATGLATFDTFLWETDASVFPRGDWALLDKCRRVRPDAIILSSYDYDYPGHPRLETIRLLRDTWGIPIVTIWWDTCWAGFRTYIEPMMDVADLHVMADNPTLTFLADVDPKGWRERYLKLALPWDSAIYHDPGVTRDIDVSFLGQVDSYRSPRMPYIDYLMEHNVPIFWSSFDRAQQRPLSKYVEVLTRSKIALSFSQSITSHQLKGRVFEILLCGAMLMDTENPQTAFFFEPGKDYVAFDTPADMLEKVRYFLAHETERREIAARGQQKVKRYCNGTTFWQIVIGRLEERLGRSLVPTPGVPIGGSVGLGENR